MTQPLVYVMLMSAGVALAVPTPPAHDGISALEELMQLSELPAVPQEWQHAVDDDAAARIHETPDLDKRAPAADQLHDMRSLSRLYSMLRSLAQLGRSSWQDHMLPDDSDKSTSVLIRENHPAPAPLQEHDRYVRFNLPSVFKRQLALPSVFRRNFQMPSVFRRNLDMPSVFRRNLDMPSVFRRHFEMPSVFRRNFQMPSVFRRNFQMPSVFRRSFEMPSVFKRDDELVESDNSFNGPEQDDNE